MLNSMCLTHMCLTRMRHKAFVRVIRLFNVCDVPRSMQVLRKIVALEI